MKNKQIKRQICEFYTKKHNCHTPYFGCFFEDGKLMISFPAGNPPDDYYEGCEHLQLGTVSIKGKV